MIFLKMRTLLGKLGFQSDLPSKRTVSSELKWASDPEQLEERALLSAAAHHGGSSGNLTAEIASLDRKDPVVYPNVAGHWNLQVQGEFEGNGTVMMTQTDGGRTVTSQVTIPGFQQFTLVDKFKKKNPTELDSKSPRLDVPDFPLDVRLRIIIEFPQGNASPTTFTGSVQAPFVGQVATLTATKA